MRRRGECGEAEADDEEESEAPEGGGRVSSVLYLWSVSGLQNFGL